MSETGGARGQTITGIDRALDVLTLFSESGEPSLGVTEIAERLGLSKAVVHRILATFRGRGFVELDDETRRYTLGPKLLFLGLTYLDRLDTRALARQAMVELSAQTNETATLSVRSGWTRVYVDQVEPPRDVKMVVTLGTPYPLHAGASSKAFLAFLSQEEQDQFFAHAALDKITDRTITSERVLRDELREIRERGYATSLGERLAGAGSVAAPVLDHWGAPSAVISVCGPVERFRAEADRAADLLLAATRRVSEQLGYRRDPALATR